MNVSEIIKHLRESRGLSQEQLADNLGVDRTTIVKYETGASKPTRNLQKIADYFHVSTDYLLGRTPNPNQEITLGEYIRAARQHVGYSPEYVEKLTGIKADTLLEWEKNAATPNEDEKKTLAKLYHLSVDILTGENIKVNPFLIRPILSAEENLAADLFHAGGYYTDEETARIANEMKETPGKRVLFKAVADLPPDKIQQVRDFVDFITRDKTGD